MSAILTFDAEAHVYRVDGAEIPSVTQILERTGLVDFSRIPPAIRRAALNRGRRVHAAAQFLTEGTLDWASVDESERGYVEAAASFLDDAEFQVLAQERRIYHAALRYAGTDDIIGIWHDQPAIGDYCTGDTWEACKDLQTSAYAAAEATAWPDAWLEFKPTTPIARVGIRLHKDGFYKATPYRDPMDFRKFQAAVTVAHEQIARRKKGLTS